MNLEPTIPITVLVQTKNEEVGIGECLEQLSVFNEVIVVDSQSTDRTREIVQSAGFPVVDFIWDGQYPKKKQWQLENIAVRNDWVLFLDADETPSAKLIEELRAIFSTTRVHEVAFDIDLDYVFGGRVLKHGHRVTKRCLVRPGSVHFPEMNDLDLPGMGELEGHYQPLARGGVRRLRGRIVHNDLDPVSTWFARHNRYSDWEAGLRAKGDARRQIRERRNLKGRLFDAIPFKPLVFFLYAYILRAGFLDGRAGFDYAFALSTYYWQITVKYNELIRSREYT
jgi:glycosyltransferase involved in cell wall biosynthesis